MVGRAAGEVFNVGSECEVSILELAELVKELGASSSEIVFVPYDQAYEIGFEDMRRRVPDLTKIKQWIGYKETLDLRGIVSQVIAYHRETVNAQQRAVRTEL